MGTDVRRISIRDKQFSGIPPHQTGWKGSITVIVIGVAYVSRMYYAEEYDTGNRSSPTCWSADTDYPATEVPEAQRQAGRCIDCPRSIKGSGKGGSRACRFTQRIAVVFEDDLEAVYQLQLPSTSIFGDAVDGQMPLRAYARYLEAQATPIVTVTTQIRFVDRSGIPKLFFRPVRPLSEEELTTVKEMMEHPCTVKALTHNVVSVEDMEVSPFSPTNGFKINS
tara:strand:+ start:963 stop:1631 length:669 start_codon:yes stop_codon:yes gene_type:complete